ncbi:kelch-like protein diablo [Daphnia carinata]|uniref:kelch-like protein diablo n=1 Tax=Daphnia carinata TaxID=120202 RepID=UPI00257B0F9B|nr:kelch-like protein diablo [Daphnia carinata]
MLGNDQGIRNCNVCCLSVQQANPTVNSTTGQDSEDQQVDFWDLRDAVFPTVLMDGLNDLRTSGLLCDVVLVTGDSEHSAQRVVLAAVSPYFRAMFSGTGNGLRFLESEQSKITLHDIDSAILEQILNFIYTAEIQITEKNVSDFLVAADFLQINSLQNLCCQYLRSQMNASNCIGIYLSAKSRNCKELAANAKRYTLEHFRHVVKEEELLQLPFNELKGILQSPLLNTAGEGELLETVMKWVEHQPGDRLQFLSSLVSEIDVWQVPAEKLLVVVNSDLLLRRLRDSGFTSEAQFSETAILGGDFKMAVDKILSQRCDSPCSKTQPHHITHSKKIRHSYEQEVIVALGGESNGFVLNSMECYTLGYDGWRCSIPTAVALSGIPNPTQVMPPMRTQRIFPAFCSADYTIFIIGGICGEKLIDSCEFYSVQSNEWISLAPLPIGIHGSGAALPNQVLCVSGGRSDQGIEKRAWMYEERFNMWEALPSMQLHRAHHGVTSLNCLLYAVGGLGGKQQNEEKFLSSVECYDPALQRWIPIAPMHEARAYCGVATVGSFLYVIGGFNGVSWLRSMERYDPLTNQWTLLTPMSVARSSFGTTVWNGRIYVIGGSDGIHLLNTAEKFNPRTNRWHCAQAMQVRRLGLGAATVKIPLKME